MNTFNRILVATAFCLTLSSGLMAQSGRRDLGIAGTMAPDWETSAWYQLPAGKQTLSVNDYKGKVVFLYFFQSWCPGCHRSGFPTLQKVSEAFKGDDRVAFAAIQTTFEGHGTNTKDKLKEMAQRYKLAIPFGQSAGASGTPDIMKRYRTGGTPWVVLIDPQGRVVFNDFHIAPEKAVAAIRKMVNSSASRR